jgi:hypothetical protein
MTTRSCQLPPAAFIARFVSGSPRPLLSRNGGGKNGKINEMAKGEGEDCLTPRQASLPLGSLRSKPGFGPLPYPRHAFSLAPSAHGAAVSLRSRTKPRRSGTGGQILRFF